MNSGKLFVLILLVASVAGALLVYSQDQTGSTLLPIGTPVQITAPLGLPPVPIPPDNPPTAATIALGRRLYYAPILSLDNSVSCASCHSPQ
jgi:cytochrome c peroxidase